MSDINNKLKSLFEVRNDIKHVLAMLRNNQLDLMICDESTDKYNTLLNRYIDELRQEKKNIRSQILELVKGKSNNEIIELYNGNVIIEIMKRMKIKQAQEMEDKITAIQEQLYYIILSLEQIVGKDK